jgi:hypothetical protein
MIGNGHSDSISASAAFGEEVDVISRDTATRENRVAANSNGNFDVSFHNYETLMSTTGLHRSGIRLSTIGPIERGIMSNGLSSSPAFDESQDDDTKTSDKQKREKLVKELLSEISEVRLRCLHHSIAVYASVLKVGLLYRDNSSQLLD